MTPDRAEIWLPVHGHPGYEVGDLGNIRSIDRLVIDKNGRRLNYKGRVKKLRRSSGYLTVDLGWYEPTHKVHRLVAAAFLGPRPPGAFVCHRNDDKADNRPDNLYYGSNRSNSRDKVLNGKQQRLFGSQNGATRYDTTTVHLVLSAKGTMSTYKAAAHFGISQTYVRDLWNGKRRQNG